MTKLSVLRLSANRLRSAPAADIKFPKRQSLRPSWAPVGTLLDLGSLMMSVLLTGLAYIIMPPDAANPVGVAMIGVVMIISISVIRGMCNYSDHQRVASWIFLTLTAALIFILCTASSEEKVIFQTAMVLSLLVILAAILLDNSADLLIYILLIILSFAWLYGLGVGEVPPRLSYTTGLSDLLWSILIIAFAGLMSGFNQASYRRLRLNLDKKASLINGQLENLIRRERLVALGTMVASLGHQLSNPLQVITFALDTYLTEERQAGRPISELVRMAREHLDLLNRILETMSSFARPNSMSKSQLVDTTKAIGSAVGLARSRIVNQNITLAIQLDPQRPSVLMAPSELEQVLTVLIDNALDAMLDMDEGVLGVTLNTIGANVMIIVSDTGTGISEDTEVLLFEPFNTTKAEGTGLGLFVAYNIMARCGGSIEYKRTNNTEFVISIPIARGRFL